MGRRKIDIDLEQVARLAAIGTPIDDIAFVIGCHRSTLYDRDDVAEALGKGQAQGRTSLRRKQWSLAMGRDADPEKGDPGERPCKTMLIWLGKQMLGQKDRMETSTPDVDAAIERELERLAAGGKAPVSGAPSIGE